MTAPRPAAVAYLCMEHRIGRAGIPVFRGFRIFSSEPWHLSAESSKSFHTMYYRAEGVNYDIARERILDLCQNFKPFQWIWPWVDPSREAHMRRLDLEAKLDALDIEQPSTETSDVDR